MQTTINIDFAIGDEAYTIDTSSMRLVNFVVRRIFAYADDKGHRAYLYPEKSITKTEFYSATSCFHSKEDLMSHLLED